MSHANSLAHVHALKFSDGIDAMWLEGSMSICCTYALPGFTKKKQKHNRSREVYVQELYHFHL